MNAIVIMPARGIMNHDGVAGHAVMIGDSNSHREHAVLSGFVNGIVVRLGLSTVAARILTRQCSHVRGV